MVSFADDMSHSAAGSICDWAAHKSEWPHEGSRPLERNIPTDCDA